jgi:hypothetical protein
MIFALKSTFSLKKRKILWPKVTEIFMIIRKSFVNIHPEQQFQTFFDELAENSISL